MILLEDAYKIVIDSSFGLSSETIPFMSSVKRILAENIVSDIEMPPFDKSAMDGYACKLSDIENKLEVVEVIPAGKSPVKEIKENQCAQIMTGAMLPKGADCVLMVEHVEKVGDNKIKYTLDATKTNICIQGEDVKEGDVVINKGTEITPQHIAIMASVGCVNPKVSKKPKVGIISTGDELVEPNTKPGISKIRNSNAYQLIAQVEKAGALANYVGIAEDNEEATYNIINKAIKENDIVLLTGGVSMGEFDFVPAVLKKAGVDIKFQKIAVQPGKPTTFGVHDKALIFGLPGNPVSSFIQFELLVKPLIYRMMGGTYHPLNIKMPLEEIYNRKKSARESWIPVVLTEKGTVLPVSYHGSAHIHALHNAHGIMVVPIGKIKLNKGEIVDVRPI